MDFPKFIIDNFQLIKANPAPFIFFAFLMFGLAWLIISTLYKERLETLKERISSRDDQIKYYKELSEAKQSPPSPAQTEIPKKPDNLHSAILREIEYLEQNAGRALSVQLFERLQIKYPFIIILSELLAMNKNGEVQWAEAPKPPDALSVLTVLKRKE